MLLHKGRCTRLRHGRFLTGIGARRRRSDQTVGGGARGLPGSWSGNATKTVLKVTRFASMESIQIGSPGSDVISRRREKRRRDAAAHCAAVRHPGVVARRTGAVTVDRLLVGAGQAKRIAERVQNGAGRHRASRPRRGEGLQHKHERRGKRDECPRCTLPLEQDAPPLRKNTSSGDKEREATSSPCANMTAGLATGSSKPQTDSSKPAIRVTAHIHLCSDSDDYRRG